MVLVGKKAPAVAGAAVINGGEIVENFSLEQYKGKYVIFFFYPADFTFVCPTELIAFQEKIAEFNQVEKTALTDQTTLATITAELLQAKKTTAQQGEQIASLTATLLAQTKAAH